MGFGLSAAFNRTEHMGRKSGDKHKRGKNSIEPNNMLRLIQAYKIIREHNGLVCRVFLCLHCLHDGKWVYWQKNKSLEKLNKPLLCVHLADGSGGV